MDGQSGTRSALGELQLNAGADDGISDDGAGAFAPPSAAQLMERSAATQEGVAALLSFGGAEAGAAGSNEPWPSDHGCCANWSSWPHGRCRRRSGP